MKKKKGSSLVTVVVIFAVLFTVGTAVLTMTVSDYKARIAESKRVENLYGADSGIDTAYNITGQVLKLVIDKSNSYTESSNIDLINNAIRGNNSTYVNPNGTLDKDAITSALNPAFKEKYRELIKRDLLYCVKHRETISNIDATTEALRYSQPIEVYTKSNPQFDDSTLEGIDEHNNVTDSNEVKFKLTIKSKYQDASSSNGVRTVVAVYYIDVPNYSGNYGINNQSVSITTNAVTQKAIAADGDLIIDSVSGADINGPIFIKGKESSGTASIAYSKYSGGISINNVSGNVGFNGDVVTSRTFRVVNNATKINVANGNTLFANNIYLGKDENGSSVNTKIQAATAIIDNDLTLNGVNAKAYITEFYAVNDINREKYDKKGSEERSSSSIIMNSVDSESEILINNKAYILGTAYINTGQPYQTGESTAVKGNYKAYNTIIPEDSTGYFYKYYDPLTLVDKQDITVVDKAAHFYNYAKKHQDKGALNITDQIKLPDNNHSTISAGAYISRGIVYPSYYPSGDKNFLDDLTKKRRSYAQQVYEMGAVPLSDTSILDGDYNNAIVQKSVETETKSKLSQNNNNDYMDFSNDGSNEGIIINTNPNKRIFIKGGNPAFNEPINSTGSNADIVVDKGQSLNAVIISAGDVFISGDISYNGTIITKGSVKIEGINNSGNVKIYQDSNVRNKLFAKYKTQVSNVINIDSNSIQSISRNIVPSTSIKSNINLDSIIHKGQWSINKK